MGTGVTGCEDDIGRQLVFNVEIVLLNHSLFEVEVLRPDRPAKSADRRRRGKDRKTRRDVANVWTRIGNETGCHAEEWTLNGFCEEWRILPQPLGTLI